MSAQPERRTRPTIRCLHDDLGIELPTVDVDLGSTEHPLMEDARRVAPATPGFWPPLAPKLLLRSWPQQRCRTGIC
jgi:hypothetical protein